MLTGNEIRIQIASGGLDVKPYDEACIGPNSYDVHLGDQLVVYTEAVLDAKQENRTRTITIPEEGIVLRPGRLYLGKTVEWTSSPGFVPMYEGRSSLGRLGVSSHITAGFGDIGFEGNWTLEISVVQPVRIYPGMRIGQLYWHKPVGEITSTYCGKYQGQEGIQASRLYEDREWREPMSDNVKWTREKILDEAKQCVCGNREQDYGGPEDNFRKIGDLWSIYLDCNVKIDAYDVAAMMALLKIARLANNPEHMDSWVDLAGYAACGGEIAGRES